MDPKAIAGLLGRRVGFRCGKAARGNPLGCRLPGCQEPAEHPHLLLLIFLLLPGVAGPWSGSRCSRASVKLQRFSFGVLLPKKPQGQEGSVSLPHRPGKRTGRPRPMPLPGTAAGPGGLPAAGVEDAGPWQPLATHSTERSCSRAFRLPSPQKLSQVLYWPSFTVSAQVPLAQI